MLQAWFSHTGGGRGSTLTSIPAVGPPVAALSGARWTVQALTAADLGGAQSMPAWYAGSPFPRLVGPSVPACPPLPSQLLGGCTAFGVIESATLASDLAGLAFGNSTPRQLGCSPCLPVSLSRSCAPYPTSFGRVKRCSGSLRLDASVSQKAGNPFKRLELGQTKAGNGSRTVKK